MHLYHLSTIVSRVRRSKLALLLLFLVTIGVSGLVTYKIAYHRSPETTASTLTCVGSAHANPMTAYVVARAGKSVAVERLLQSLGGTIEARPNGGFLVLFPAEERAHALNQLATSALVGSVTYPSNFC